MQGNPPIPARDYLVRPQHLNLDQLFEGRLEGLHQPRQVLGRIENPQVLGDQLPGIHDNHVGLGERYRQVAVQVLDRNAIQFHVAVGIQQAEETAVHGLDQFIGPRHRAGAAPGGAIERETGLLEHVAPLHFLVLLRSRQGPEAQWNETVHGQLQAFIELPVNRADIQNPRDLTPRERHRLGKIVAEGKNSQRHENV